MGIRSLAAELLPSALQGRQRNVFAPTPTKAQVASFAALTERLNYLSKADHKKVLEAFKFADEAHLGQFLTGEPHHAPIAVEAPAPTGTLVGDQAALMHDTTGTRVSPRPS
jgi:GTP pyrophosphokinase/guanosine-3',5'-bis(diphosphate) 3'-pyrophosphohydrolase